MEVYLVAVIAPSPMAILACNMTFKVMHYVCIFYYTGIFIMMIEIEATACIFCLTKYNY